MCNQSEIPKLLDRLVSVKLSWDMKQVINLEQFGFFRGRSTETNLVLYENFILNQMEGGWQVDSVYTDFSKAFDRVNHHLLFLKLKAIGIRDPLLSWFKSFVTGRSY